MSALARLFLAATSTMVLVAPPALADAPPASTTIWGYSGLVVMPSAHVHGFRDYSVGLQGLTMATSTYHGLPYISAGLFEGLEAGLVYGIPVTGFTGLTGHAKYQLVKPTRERPTAVAMGLTLVGVNGPPVRFVAGNTYYLVVSQDVNTTIGGSPYTLFALHGGFAGDISFGSHLMGGLDIPFGDKFSLVGDVMGPQGAVGPYFNVGLNFRPLREWQLRATTIGTPGGQWSDRDYGLAISYTGTLFGNRGGGSGASPAVRKDPAPTRLVVSPTLAPTAGPTAPPPSPIALPGVPTPLPRDDSDTPATLQGTVLDDRGRPLTGWTVAISGMERPLVTDLKGRYQATLPMGPYEIVVRDIQGNIQLSKSIRLVTPKGLDLPLVVTLPVGEFKGMVVDRASKQGLGEATIQLFRAGETYNLTNREGGSFYLGDLPAGPYRVVVTRSRYQAFEAEIEVEAKKETSLIVPMLQKPGSLAGKVTNLKGQGQPGVVITIPALKLVATTDRLGAYAFNDVPAGTHEVAFQQGVRRLATTSVRVRSDETTTENVTASPAESMTSRGGTITGTVADAATHKPLASVRLVVVGAGDLTVLTITSSDGHFSVADLPAGKYKVTATKAGFAKREATATVTAKSGANLNLTLAK